MQRVSELSYYIELSYMAEKEEDNTERSIGAILERVVILVMIVIAYVHCGVLVVERIGNEESDSYVP